MENPILKIVVNDGEEDQSARTRSRRTRKSNQAATEKPGGSQEKLPEQCDRELPGLHGMLKNDHSHGPMQDQPCCRGRLVIKSGQPRLGVNKEHDHDHPENCQKPCCRRHLVDMLGRGRQEFPIPTKEKVLRDIATKIAQHRVGVPAGALAQEIEEAEEAGEKLQQLPDTRSVMRLLDALSKRVKDDGKNLPAPNAGAAGNKRKLTGRKLKANANANRVAAEVIRLRFFDERWKAAVARKFNPSRGVLRRARKSADSRYQAAIDSLDAHYTKLRELYRGALPQAYDMLKMQYPNETDAALRGAAVQLLDQQEELAQIIYVLEHYVLAFEQLEDPEYESIQAVTTTVEEALNLFLTGDIIAARGKARQALAETVNLVVGNCFLPHAGEDGPATIPGATGPVGLHLILVPEDEVGIIMLMMVLYLHEFRHDIANDIKDLLEEEAMAVIKQLKEAHAGGRIKLSAETIMLGPKTKVQLIDLLAKLFLDLLGEMDADLVGGIEMCGWAFALNMLYVFGAFNSKKDGAIRTRELLRTSSYFQVNKKGELWFESHPVDYFRLYLLATALEMLGYKEEAVEIRDLADSGVGSKKPEFITYFDAEDKREPIKLRMSDLMQCAPVVVEAILMTPFKALKGKSNHDIVAWSQKRQDKVDALVDILVKHVKSCIAGEQPKMELPASLGDVYATYVAAAAAVAFYQLICAGELDPAEIPEHVNQSALQMLAVCMQNLKTKQAATAEKAPADPAVAKAQGPVPAPAAPAAPAGSKPVAPERTTDSGMAADSSKPLGLRGRSVRKKNR